MQTLVGLVRGDLSEAPDLIQSLLDDVLEVLYGDPATGGVTVPDAFWRDSPFMEGAAPR